MKDLKEKSRKSSSAVSAETEKYLTFSIDKQLYTVPTSQVVEIIRMQPITFIPNVTKYVKGVINLRGKVVPVIDMRLRFQKEAKEYDTLTSIVIVECGEMMVGMIVDFVKDVRDVSADQINPSPKSKNVAGKNFVSGIVKLENESAMLLDTAKVLTHHHRNEVQAQKNEAAPDKSKNSEASAVTP